MSEPVVSAASLISADHPTNPQPEGHKSAYAVTDRWTAETEELVHRTLHDLDVRINNLTGDHHCNLVSQVVLTALADAGLLLPPGGDTRWKRGHGASTSGYKRSVTTWPDGSQLFGPWVAVSEP